MKLHLALRLIFEYALIVVVLFIVSCEPPEISVSKLIVSPRDVAIEVGETVQLSVTIVGSDGNIINDRPVSWSSSHSAMATVTQSGKVTGVSIGEGVIISAKCDGVSGSSYLTINPIHVEQLELFPANDTIEIGETLQLTATLKDIHGNVLINRSITWASSNTAIATVSSTGLITGISSNGSVTITASCEGKSKTTDLLVTEAAVSTVQIIPANSSIFEGNQLQLSATILDSRGASLSNRIVFWSSSNTELATITNTGLLTGEKAGGPILITATCEGINGQAEIIINPPERVAYWVEHLPVQISIALDENITQFENNPSAAHAPLLLIKINLLQNPNLATEIVNNRYYISFKLNSIDNRRIPFTTFFISEEMRGGANFMMDTYKIAFPILENFMQTPISCANIDIRYGFTLTNSNNGCFLNLDDKETLEAMANLYFDSPYTQTLFERVFLHELTHKYIGNEQLNKFLEQYIFNVINTNSTDTQLWIYPYGPYIPLNASNEGLYALYDIYQLIGVQGMSNAYRRLGELYPPYNAPLSADCKQAFIDQAPSNLKEQVAALTNKITSEK